MRVALDTNVLAYAEGVNDLKWLCRASHFGFCNELTAWASTRGRPHARHSFPPPRSGHPVRPMLRRSGDGPGSAARSSHGSLPTKPSVRFDGGHSTLMHKVVSWYGWF